MQSYWYFFQISAKRRAGRSAWYDRRVRNAEAAGSNPARSIIKAENANSPLNSSPFSQSTTQIRLKPEILKEFDEFMRVNMRLEARTALDTIEHTRRYLSHSNYTVSYETASDYLKSFLNKAPKTYNSQITSLRRFIRDFLHAPECIVSFKMAPVDYKS